MKKVLISLVLLASLAGAVFYFTQKNGVSDISLQQSDKVSGSWRYKLTVVVDTPEGERSGFAVREVHAKRQDSLLNQTGKSTKINVLGEAVVVDLGQRGILFALMDFDAAHKIIYQTFSLGDVRSDASAIKKYENLYSVIGDQKKRLDPAFLYFPMFVKFDDINEPKSVRSVLKRDPDDVRKQGELKIYEDYFEELFGEGVALKGVYIQMTNEEITRKITNILPWLDEMRGRYIGGKNSGSGPELWKRLHEGSFRRGNGT